MTSRKECRKRLALKNQKISNKVYETKEWQTIECSFL